MDSYGTYLIVVEFQKPFTLYYEGNLDHIALFLRDRYGDVRFTFTPIDVNKPGSVNTLDDVVVRVSSENGKNLTTLYMDEINNCRAEISEAFEYSEDCRYMVIRKWLSPKDKAQKALDEFISQLPEDTKVALQDLLKERFRYDE